MPSVGRAPRVLLLAALFLVPVEARESDTARAMREAAAAFLATLDTGQRERISFPFASEERFNWHFTPVQRKGLPLYALTPPQREAAMALLKAGLSETGFQKTEAIRALDGVLFEIEGPPAKALWPDGRPRRDPERYLLTIFGTPAADAPWGWRYEGHHISQNWTVVGGTVVSGTPQMFGANPAEVRTGPKAGARALAAEEDLARTFLSSLDDTQRAAAIVSPDAPDDILTMERPKVDRLEDQGLEWARLTAGQQGLLLKIVEEYAFAHAASIGQARMARVRKDGLPALKFAWMGSTERGQRHYYRIQGSSFVIEYDNTQNNANHIHAVWRDFSGDFGRDLLAEHYRVDHAPVARR